jgi:hypothetical protein
MSCRCAILVTILVAIIVLILDVYRYSSAKQGVGISPECGYPFEISVEDALRKFNRSAGRSPIGRSELPLTKNELFAFLTHSVASEGLPDEKRAIYRKILETGMLPKGAWLSFVTGFKEADKSPSVEVWQIILETNLDRIATRQTDSNGKKDLHGLNLYSDVIRLRYVECRRQW